MASSPIVTGLMAYGMSGKVFHAPFVQQNPGFTFKAIVERTRKEAAERYPDVISYDTTEQLLNDAEIELIIVNSPNYLHYEQARAALLAGKHVLVEKPATATVDEFMELTETARRMNKHLLVYQNRRFTSEYLAVKEVIESGRLGNLIEVHFRYDRYRAAVGAKKFKEQAAYPANGLLYDLGPHLLDQAISLFGKPVAFHKFTAAHRVGSEVNDFFTYQLIYPYNLVVTLTASLLAAAPGISYLIHGTAGSFTKDRTDTQEAQLLAGMWPDDAEFGLEPEGSEGKLVTVQGVDDKITEQVPCSKGEYMHIFDAVHHTIRNGALYPVTDEQVAWQLELLQADDN